MPPLTRWFIKTSFVYFILALLVGLLLGAQNLSSAILPDVDIFPVYFHLFAEGWITLLIIGVAYWMFPKYTLDQPRGSQTLGWASYILLNAGLLLRIISEPASGAMEMPASIWDILMVFSALLQWLGGMAFVANSWGRVKEK